MPEYDPRHGCDAPVNWMDTHGYSVTLPCGAVTWEGEKVMCSDCWKKLENAEH